MFTFLSIQTFGVKFRLKFMITWKSNQNGILVCEIRWTFEVLRFWSDDVVVGVLRELEEEEGVDLLPSLLTSGPHTQFLSYMQFFSFAPPPPFRSAPHSLFISFLAFFFIISRAFIYFFLSFFPLLSISRNMQHYIFFYFPLFNLFSLP